LFSNQLTSLDTNAVFATHVAQIENDDQAKKAILIQKQGGMLCLLHPSWFNGWLKQKYGSKKKEIMTDSACYHVLFSLSLKA